MHEYPKRVLHVVASLGRGGSETMIMNHYRKIDRTKIQFDFLVNYPHKGEYEEEVISLGGNIYRTMPVRPWNYHKYFKCLDKFFSEHHDYIAIHAHIQDNSGFALKYAAKYGINCRIANSHVADFGFDYRFPFWAYARHYLKKYVNQKFACGNSAGQFMFGKDSDYIVFHNAIDTQRYLFNPEIRNLKREELGLTPDTYAIGHIGRFHPQKNHPMLLRIFAELLKITPNSVLLLCGSGGKLIDKMRQLAHDLGISESVRFLGSRDDIPQLMQAMDVVVFPSIFEGLPVSIIEAQAAGLRCILSDTIDQETAVTDLVSFHSLKMPVQQWAQTIIDAKGYERTNTQDQISKAGYDVYKNVQWLTNFYLTH